MEQAYKIRKTLVLWVLVLSALTTARYSYGLTLSGDIFLPSGFTTVDINVVVEVAELDSTNSIVNSYLGNTTITANSGNARYTVENINAAPGNNYSIRYFCNEVSTDRCGKYVSEVYYTPTGTNRFEFTQGAVVGNQQLPSALNFTLVIGNTVTGNIVFPKPLSKNVSVITVARFFPPESVGRAQTLFISPETVDIPAGTTSMPYIVEGIPPIENKAILMNSVCESCEPDFLLQGFVDGFDSSNPAATTLPSNQNSSNVGLFFMINPDGPLGDDVTITPIINFLLD